MNGVLRTIEILNGVACQGLLIPGRPYFFLAMFAFPTGILTPQDAAEPLLQPLQQRVVAQGTAAPLLLAKPVQLLFAHGAVLVGDRSAENSRSFCPGTVDSPIFPDENRNPRRGRSAPSRPASPVFREWSPFALNPNSPAFKLGLPADRPNATAQSCTRT